MTVEREAVESALETFGPGTRLDVTAEHVGLLRYARSQATAQHDERRFRVRVRVTREGRTASGMLETLAPGPVHALASRLEADLDILPRRNAEPAAIAPADGSVTVPEANEATLRAGAAERHAWFEAVRNGLRGKAELGGAIRHDVVERVVASHGLYRAETLTKASLQAVAEREGRAASVRRVHRDAAAIEVGDIAGRLLDDLRPLPSCEPWRGPCRVLLRPQAAITLIGTYGYVALGAAGYEQRRTAVAGRLGQHVASELVTLVDDGSDPAGLPSGFDVEGTPRQRTPLIEHGLLRGIVSNGAWAHVTEGRSTGHGVPDGWRFGADPSPSHLLLENGEASEAELLEACGSGLVISRLDYLRVLHPKQTLVTGTTRDGTYAVRDGRVVARHPRVRLTFRLDEVLSTVVAVGAERERGELVFMESVVAPAILVEAGPFRL